MMRVVTNASSNLNSQKPNSCLEATLQDVADDKRGIAYAIGLLIKGSEVVKLIDRDDQSDQQVADMMEGRVRVLSRRNLESYLFDDEVLERLAKSVGKDDKGAELSAKKKSIRESRPDDPPDDLKPSSGQILPCLQADIGPYPTGKPYKDLHA